MNSTISGKSFKIASCEKIGLDKEVQKICRFGHRFSDGELTLIWLARSESASESYNLQRSGASSCRFAIRVAHNFGNAVIRNRVKRILRELFRREKWNLRSNTDLLFIMESLEKGHSSSRMSSCAQRLNYSDLREKFLFLCKKAGI